MFNNFFAEFEMKKVFILFLMSIIFSSLALSRTIDIKKSGGGSNGYNIVYEHHDDGGWFDEAESTLSCNDPGNSKCEWTINPTLLPSMIGPGGGACPWEDLYNYANNQILSNVLTGSYTDNIIITGDYWYRSLSWSATDVNNSRIIINNNLAGL